MAEHNDTETKEEKIKKIGEFIMDIDFTMMTTIDENSDLQSRPMSTQNNEFDGNVYFFTYSDSNKLKHIKANPRVNLAYSDPSKQTYISLRGNAGESRDRAKMEEMWSPEMNAWFPDGLDTEGITLIKVEVESAEYWDTPTSFVTHAIGLVKAKLTGKVPHIGDNKTVEFD